MQNKNIKDLLLTSLITSDFLLLEKNSTALRHIKFVSKHNSLELSSLDLFETLKSVKELINLLRFISNSEKKSLQIIIENKQYLRILNFFFKKSKTTLKILIKNAFVSNLCDKSVNQLVLLLTDSVTGNSTLFKNFVQNNIFLINKINTKIEQNSWGSYKLYNDLSDLKKFLFIVILLDILLKKKDNK